MPISSSDGGSDTTCVSDVSSHARSLADRTDSERPAIGAAVEDSKSRAPKNCVRQSQSALSYPWLIERLSQTFFQEWRTRHFVWVRLDDSSDLCTRCGEYQAAVETRYDTWCKYCWSLEQAWSLVGPAYLDEVIRYDV